MAESALSKLIMRHLLSAGDALRIENMAGVGTPDINYCIAGCEGWIENKWIAAWPVRETNIVRLDHFTAAQRVWHARRARAGGKSFVLLQVSRPTNTYALFTGAWAAASLGRCSIVGLRSGAVVWGTGGGLPWDQIRAELCRKSLK